MLFAWTCTRLTSQVPCFSGSELSSSSAVVTIPSSSLVVTSGDSYVFSVTSTKGSRSATATVTISTSALPLPAVSIQPVPAFVTVDSRVVLRGAAEQTGTLITI